MQAKEKERKIIEQTTSRSMILCVRMSFGKNGLCGN